MDSLTDSKPPQVNSLGVSVMTAAEMLATMIATTGIAFLDRKDRSGKPYVLHCLKVMHYLEPYGMQIQAMGCGHDLFEDTGVTAKELLEKGFSDRVIDCIMAVTKMPGQSYDEYKQAVFADNDAVLVKMADVRHNSDLRRIKGVRQKDFDRHVEYMKFFHELEAVALERGLMRARAE